MANNDDVGVKSFEILDGVFESLAFFQRRSVGGKINHVGGETLRGEFERNAGARGGFDEKVDDGFAAEGGHFFDGAFANGFKLFGCVEREGDFFGAQRLDIEEMFSVPGHASGRTVQGLILFVKGELTDLSIDAACAPNRKGEETGGDS